MTRAIPKAVTISEFRDASGLSRPTIYKMIRAGQLPGYKIGSRYVIPRPWFEQWLAGEWTPPAEEEVTGEEPATTDDNVTPFLRTFKSA